MVSEAFTVKNMPISDGIARMQRVHGYLVSLSPDFNKLSPLIRENIIILINNCNNYLSCVFVHNRDYIEYNKHVKVINDRITKGDIISTRVFNELASRYALLVRTKSYSKNIGCEYPGIQIKESVYAIKGRTQ